MKKNLIKKAFAVSLSIAMAFSFLPTANPITASAKAPYVSLKTTFKTLKIGQNYRMTLKNNTVGWKIKKVETTDKTIATVHSKTIKDVMIKGKSEGRATVRVRLKTTKRKTHTTKTLRCRVKVVKPTTDVVNPPVGQTETTVATQAELDAALADSNIKKITIKTDAATSFTIKEGTYSVVDLIVDAPNADVTNNATFKSITINNIKEETFTENAKGNTITFKAPKGRIVIGKNASVNGLIFDSTGKADVQVEEGATVNNVNIKAAVKLNMTGKSAKAIPVRVEATAKDAEVVFAIPVVISVNANVKINLEAGSAGSSISIDVAGVAIVLTNRSGATVIVKKVNGVEQSVPNNTVNSTISAPTTPSTPGGSTTWPGGSGGSTVTKPATNNYVVSPGAIQNVDIAVEDSSEAVSPAAATTNTPSAVTSKVATITVDVSGATANSPAAVECRVLVEWVVDGKTTRYTLESWKDCTNNSYTDNSGKKTYPALNTVQFKDKVTLKADTITVIAQYRVKETATSAASTIKETREPYPVSQ